MDHLLNFASEDAAKADPVIGQLYFPGDPDFGIPAQWSGSCVPGVSVYTGTYENRTQFGGWWLLVGLQDIDTSIRDCGHCVLIADPLLASVADSNILFTSNPPAGLLSQGQVDPVFAT